MDELEASPALGRGTRQASARRRPL
jgi:hypothetical protein